MKLCILVLLCLAFGVVGWPELPSQVPDPKALLQASQAAYQDLRSFTATLTFSIASERFSFATEIAIEIRVFCSYPWARYEFEAVGDFPGQPVLVIVDHQAGRAWTLFADDKWEEVLDESWKEPMIFPLGALEPVGLKLSFEPHTVFSEKADGQELWVVVGRSLTSIPPMEAKFWLDKQTLLLVRVEWSVFGLNLSVTVEDFQANPALSPDLFQPPAPELIAKTFTIIPEGRKVIQAAWEKLWGHKTFVVRKREKGGLTEEVLTYRHPFLRVEQKRIPISKVPGDLLSLTIRNFSDGFVYHYDPVEDSWSKRRFVFKAATPEESLYFAIMEAFRLGPPDLVQPVGFSETVVQGRKVWHITDRGFPGADKPVPEWWIDKETLQVLQYTEPMMMGKRRTTRYVEIQSVELNVEVPAELFSVPPDVPEKTFAFPKEKPGAPLEGWEGFTWKAFEEAKAQGKAIVLYFTAEWCAPCLALEARVLRDPKVRELLAPLARFKVDLTELTGETKKVADLYKVRVFPTLIFLDPTGKELGRITGFLPTPKFISRIREILGAK